MVIVARDTRSIPYVWVQRRDSMSLRYADDEGIETRHQPAARARGRLIVYRTASSSSRWARSSVHPELGVLMTEYKCSSAFVPDVCLEVLLCRAQILLYSFSSAQHAGLDFAWLVLRVAVR
jgi:hypothetical protein